MWEALAASVAVVVAVAGLWFAAYQTRMTRVANEVNLNLSVMERLDGVLLTIADRPEVREVIWSNERATDQDNGPSHVLTQSLIDVLEMSLMACERVPGFATNAEDWRKYAEYVWSSSASVRQELEGDGAAFWPYLHRWAVDAGQVNARP